MRFIRDICFVVLILHWSACGEVVIFTHDIVFTIRRVFFVSSDSNTVALEEFPTINVGMFYPLYSYPEMSALFSN
jgi:hypothetical protein